MNFRFARDVGLLRYFFRSLRRKYWIWFKRNPHTVFLPTGLPIQLPKGSGCASEVFITQCNIDWGSEALLASLVDPKGMFLDVGANIGYYTLYMLPKVTGVIAVEPDPRNLSALAANLREHSNVYTHATPVFREESDVWFEQGPRGDTSAIRFGGPTPRTIPLRAVTLDSVWYAHGKPFITAIKIDVEGSDFDVLQSAEGLVDRDHPLILMELNRRSDLPQLHAWASGHSYSLFAYVRACEGDRGARSPRLRPISRSENSDWKMIFVVPARLKQTFCNRADA